MENLQKKNDQPLQPQQQALAVKRKEKDVMKLLVSEYEVKIANEKTNNELLVKMKGPMNSPYEGGVWLVRVLLPEQYPFKSPSIGFVNKIFHPNIDEGAGSVCLDVINQTWSPMFDLVNIFDVFLPQLLLYPNSADPLNSEAAQLSKNDEKYKQKIRDYVKLYAQESYVKELELKLTKEERKQEEDEPDRKIQRKDKNDDELSELSETSQVDIEESNEVANSECDDEQDERDQSHTIQGDEVERNPEDEEQKAIKQV